MMILVNHLGKLSVCPKSALESLVLILAPFAPHIAEELWQRLGHAQSLTYEPWPEFAEALTREKEIELAVQVNGKIKELSGGEAVDGFTNQVPDDQVMCAVINCGGTARIGVYPRKRIPTVDVYPGEPGGPLAQFITEDIFVSAVTPNEVTLADEAADTLTHRQRRQPRPLGP